MGILEGKDYKWWKLPSVVFSAIKLNSNPLPWLQKHFLCVCQKTERRLKYDITAFKFANFPCLGLGSCFLILLPSLGLISKLL